MVFSSDNFRRASAALSRRANRDTSGSWATGDEQQRAAYREPRCAIDENAERTVSRKSITFDLADEEKAEAAAQSKRGHNHQSSIPEVFGESAGQERRKTLRTGQHAAIICGRQKNKSGSHLAAHPEAPQPRPGSRRSSLLSGYTLDGTSPHPKHQVRSKKAIDDLRRDVETDFYEHRDHQGTARRRSMIRNVSRDDYLLARGANPRTGIITPGAHSANSSSDESGVLRARGIAPPAKWRQRGDEWISLDFGQPTPAATPPVGKGSHASQRLRTPERITSGGSDRVSRSGSTTREQTTLQHSTHSPIATPTGVPGTYPLTPSDVNPILFAANDGVAHFIPRKPVGSPSSRVPDQQPLPREVAVGIDRIANAARSSSAPSAPKSVPFTPADVGKDLPPLPTHDVARLVNNMAALPADNPFLGQQNAAQSKSDPRFAISGTCGLAFAGKELPCPPMSDGQSQFYRQAEQSLMEKSQDLKTAIEPLMQSRTLGPRGINPEYPYARTSGSRMPPSLEMRREHPGGGRPMPIPYYDNPPLHRPKNQQVPIRDPWMMSSAPHPRPENFNDVFNTAHTTTTTDTGISMSTENLYRNKYPRTHSPFLPRHGKLHRSVNMMTPTLRGYPTHGVMGSNTRLNPSITSRDLMSMDISRSPPRASSRPQMLGRAKGMHSIPRLVSVQGNIKMTDMEPAPLWNPTGMQHRNRIEDAGSQSTVLYAAQTHRPIDRLALGDRIWRHGHQQVTSSHNIHQVSLSTPAQQQHSLPSDRESSGKSNPEVSMSSPSSLTRKCSRCHDGFVKDRRRSIDGAFPVSLGHRSPTHLNTLKEGINEVNDSIKDQKDGTVPSLSPGEIVSPSAGDWSSASVAESDSRDHTICCPECCKEQDCHEGCLGHPSPAPSLTRSIRSSIETTGNCNESASTTKESDAQNNTSEKVRIGKLALMKSAFKKSFVGMPHHNCDTSKSSIHSKKNSVADLDTSAVDLPTHPLSPGTFWGREGAAAVSGAAVEAAKSAIGLKKQASVSSDDAVPAPSPLRVKKTRTKKSESLDVNRNGTAPTTTPTMDEEDRLPSPNMSPRGASGPSFRIPTPVGSTGPRSPSGKSTGRDASGTSIATVDISIPQFGSLGFRVVWEMFVVPFAASRMWLRNHPQIMSLAGRVIERGCEMAQIMLITVSRLWTIIFVYSKTGRLRMRRGDTAGSFMLDCTRSAVYLLIFVAIGVAAMRIAKWVLDVVGVLGMTIKGVVWAVKRLLGYGLFW